MTTQAGGVETYGALLEEELAKQATRKTSIEQRGIAVVTTSGALVTLLFALGALSTRAAATFVLPHGARVVLVVALVLFVIAATLALATNFPLPYKAPTAASIRRQLMKDPPVKAAAAIKTVAMARVGVLADAKKKNDYKAWMLFAALAFEVAAVATVAAAIWIVVAP